MLIKRKRGRKPTKRIRLGMILDINREFYGNDMVYSQFAVDLGISLSRLNNWLYNGTQPDYPLLKMFIKCQRLQQQVNRLSLALADLDGI